MGLSLGLPGSDGAPAAEAQESTVAPGRWPGAFEQRMTAAGADGEGFRRALADAPEPLRGSLAFLLDNMPEDDWHHVGASYLLNNVRLAHEALEGAPWAAELPREVFLNNVLPYVNASERRDDWRADLRARCLPLIADCRTPGEAARRLNERLFPAVGVRYSTARAKADQSPAESMASGLASCTGLSILLVDACRSVGVPARLAGIPDWSDGRGNHTWVEVWDAGGWHFLGAAEPDARGLDHSWFERDAAQAQRDVARHAIYAVSFRRTGLRFPVAWGPHAQEVDAENVTERYTGKTTQVAGAAGQPATVRLMVRVHDRPDGPRVPAAVSVTKAGAADVLGRGTSKGEEADTNDMLTFDLPAGQSYEVTATSGERSRRATHPGDGQKQAVLDLTLEPSKPAGAAGTVAAAKTLDPATRQVLQETLAAFYAAPVEQQARWDFPPPLQAALRQAPGEVRGLAWEAFRASPAHAALRADHAARQVTFQKYLSPYTVRAVGSKPPGGWGLVVAMHGGGGTPKEVNDSQWREMEHHYRDQPQAAGYLYLALRAPNDTWNGFYDDYVYPLVANLLRQFAVCEDVDLNRVYLIGYSHGGYGAFAIGPKIPERFAAVHSSAAAPTEGQTAAQTLRNTAFSFWVGEFDDAYDRRTRCEAFARTLQRLRGPRTDIFPYTFEEKAGFHHGDLPDREQLRVMLPVVRQTAPKELTWEQTDGVVEDFYWLRDEHPIARRQIDARCEGNVVTVQTGDHPGPFSLLLDERLIDVAQPVTVSVNGASRVQPAQPDLRLLCQEIARRADPDLARSIRLDLP